MLGLQEAILECYSFMIFISFIANFLYYKKSQTSTKE